jgi:aryl-alcohol dehydrogenase-like predicted oxidoreductase
MLEGLRRAGKVRHYGVSCDDLAALEAAAEWDGISLLQLPLDLLDEARRTGLAARIADRGIAIFAREVVRLSPTLSPTEAVASACRRPEVACCIVGTSNPVHLRAAVAAAAGS